MSCICDSCVYAMSYTKYTVRCLCHDSVDSRPKLVLGHAKSPRDVCEHYSPRKAVKR